MSVLKLEKEGHLSLTVMIINAIVMELVQA